MRRRALKDGFKKGGLYPAFFLLLTIFALSIFRIKSYDLWWHLRAGESIVGGGFEPAPTNTFSWAEPDHTWINFSWLFDVVVYLIHKAAGFNGLIVFQALLITAVFFVIYKTLTGVQQLAVAHDSKLSHSWTSALTLALLVIAYFAARFRFSLRPHLFALLIFAIDIYLLNRLPGVRGQRVPLSLWERVRPALRAVQSFDRLRTNGIEGVRVPLVAIPLLQVIWANVHGSAIIGVFLPVIYMVGRALPANHRQSVGIAHPTMLLLLTLLASLINPYGYKVFTEPFAPFFGQGADLFAMLTVDEWQMPGKDMFSGWYGLLLAIGVASFLLSFRERVRVRGDYTDLLLFSIFALLSIKAVRFIDLFVVAAVPVIYKNVVSGQPGTVPILRLRSVSSVNRDSPLHPSSLILHPFLVLSLFWFIGVKNTTFTFGLGVDKEVIPQKAVDFMERSGIRGKIFNSYNFGGYLIYRGYPVFIDGRLCYNPKLVKEYSDANLYPPHPDPFDAVRPELVEGVNGSQDRPLPQGARGVGRGWKKIEEKYGPDIVLVEYDKPAIPSALLSDKKNWALVYWDDLDMLFLKRNDKFSAIIDKNEYMAVNPMDMYGRGGSPSPGGRGLRGGGTLDIHPHPDPFDAVRPELVEGVNGSQDRPLPSRERGDILFWEKAIFTEAQKRIKDGPESMRAHLLMGNLYMNRGETNRGIVEYETVVNSSLSFGKAEAHNNLGTAYEMVGDVYSAEEEYKSAIRLDRVYPLPQRNLGHLKLEQSEYVEALWHLERYLQLDKDDRNTWAVVSELKKYRDNIILRVFIGGMAVIGIFWIIARKFNRRGTVPIYGRSRAES